MDKELKEIDDWKRLRASLNKSYSISANNSWPKAIKLFRTRLDKKFFDPLEKIITQQGNTGEGFTIVAVQCALIEALASFRLGKIFNHKTKTTSPSYEYKLSGEIFTNFLHEDKIFKDHFYTIKSDKSIIKDQPFNAASFYDNVRCGLLHEARTKKEWKINAFKTDSPTDKTFLIKKGEYISIRRTILHYRLKECVIKYCEDLGQANEFGDNLRRLFARKLDHLFDFPADPAYDWWDDRDTL